MTALFLTSHFVCWALNDKMCLLCHYFFWVEFSVLILIDRGKVKVIDEWQRFVLHLSPNRCIAVIQGPIEDCYQM